MLVAGFVLLVAGGELLVRGASGLARAVGLSPLVIGLTVVSLATSAPELAVTLGASLGGTPGLGVGNVVGSNIANVLLILGVSAVVLPLAARSRLVRIDVPVMIGLSVLVLLLAAIDGAIGRVDGAVLVLLLAGYVTWSVVAGRRAGVPDQAAPDGARAGGGAAAGARASRAERLTVVDRRRPAWDALRLLVGIGLLVLGARWLVDGAVVVAGALGVSDLVIGLTVVAIGTSLPELATSVVAALRGERDLAIGNVVGSNLFNLGAVLGLAAVVSPGGVPVEPSAIALDLPIMVVVAVALLPVAFTRAAIARWEGALFLGYYVAYVLYLVLDSTGHSALPLFNGVLLAFAVPLTAVTLTVLVAGEVRRRLERARGAPGGRPST